MGLAKKSNVIDLRTKKPAIQVVPPKKKAAIPKPVKKPPAKKPTIPKKVDRIQVHAARIDFNTFEVYMRLKKTKPKNAELYQTTISPMGNIYAKTEHELLLNIRKVLREHIDKAKQLDRLLGKKDIPVVYVNEAVNGSIIDLTE